MALQANNRNLLMRNERTMPAWVTEQSNRVGPKPPPPPLTPENGHVVMPKQPALPPKTSTLPEPDYEVIEFSNQQYSNAPLRPSSSSSGNKTPDFKLKCTLCGSNNPWVTCEECSQQIFCASCDDMFHKHPKRKTHQRKTLEQTNPPLPPKIQPGQPGPPPPVAPPRRNKRGFMTPLMQRKDQVNLSAGQFVVPPSPTPSMKSASWQDRVGSLKRGLSMSILNRPLPETPKTPTTPSESSRCTTPKSAFDNIQRPPSVVLEKIKNKANATLDRMQSLQQRYRQQKEQIERDRGGSVNNEHQNHNAFDQWSSISPSPSHFRSGSMSSGINSSHLDLTDDSSFNLFHQRQLAMQHHKLAAQRANQLGQRGMSSSVFNLNQSNRKPPPTMNNGWMNNNHMQQAQSMAQLNCANCSSHSQQPQWGGTPHHIHMPHDPWSNQLNSQQHLNRSNLSLNVSAGYMMPPPQHNGMYPPPVFMNQRGMVGQMFPQAYMGGMPVMNPGLPGMPPSVSRAASRAGSRMGSPAMSRKSVTLRRKQRSSYREDEGTDDEDSDEDDRRSMVSNRSALSRTRQRRMSSASQIQVDEDLEAATQQRARVRSQRRDSIAKSVHSDWAPGRKPTVNNNRSGDSGFNSPLKPSRIYSDLDSEGSGTRALVQAKIEQKLKEESLKQQKQSKTKRQSVSPPKQKQTAAVQTPATHAKAREEKVVKEKVVEEKPPTESESEEEEVIEEVTDEGSEEEEEEVEAVEEPKQLEPQPLPETQQNGQALAEEFELPEEVEDADSLGPPPSTPDQEWECEFCTFVNEPNIKICIICCKTPSKPPKLVRKSASPPKQVKPTATATAKTKDSKSGTLKNETLSAKGKTTLTNNTQSSTSKSKPTPIPSSSAAAASTKVLDSSENKEPTPTNSTNTLKKKESLEDIWATLDENIQATANEVTRKAESSTSTSSSQKATTEKVSTGCGTSTKSASVERQDVELRKSQAREIGTSPPPQTISTQTYDTLPLRKIETKEESPQLNSINNSQSVAQDSMQQANFPVANKFQDLKSFENEVLNNIHNISHVPSPYQYPHHQPYYPAHERHQRYRSNNDLRMDDSMSIDFDSYNGMGRRHPSISELLLLQRASSSQMHSPLTGSSYDLSYRHNGMDNHKESDLYKYTTEELNAALKYCGPDMHPLIWLRDNWPKLIQTVQSLATKYGQERAENTIGTISQMEAREALRMHTGNIWQAVSECIEQRQRKYREIFSKGNFSREDVVTALTTHQGNVDMALMDLGRTQLKPFLMRIWGSPGGVENESGAMIIPPTSPQSPQNEPYSMDKDIHNFLSANASDCMQFPNASAAFTPTNNQTPSPFDLPASLANPYDLHNPMPDNTSSYSADSNKDFGPTPPPPPIDDSILNNKSMLKDLESLIGTMEQNQQKQNEQVLRSIKDMIGNMKQNKLDVDDYDSESMRILTKSPINTSKFKQQSGNENSVESEADVKSFVWQHIQEIVPNLVQQVEMELLEDTESKIAPNGVTEENHTEEPLEEPVKEAPPPPPPIDQDEFLMEEVIKPNLKNASIREELPPQYVYTSEIATFQMAFDKALQREHKLEFKFDSLKDASRDVFKMFQAPEPPRHETAENEVEENSTAANIPATVHDSPVSSPEPAIPTTVVDLQMPATVLQGATTAEVLSASVMGKDKIEKPEVPVEMPSAEVEELTKRQKEEIAEPSIQTPLPVVDVVQVQEIAVENMPTETVVTDITSIEILRPEDPANVSPKIDIPTGTVAIDNTPIEILRQEEPANVCTKIDSTPSVSTISEQTHVISLTTTILNTTIEPENTAKETITQETPEETSTASTSSANSQQNNETQKQEKQIAPTEEARNVTQNTPSTLETSSTLAESEKQLQTGDKSSQADKKPQTPVVNQRKISKIPVRRTASNKSLILPSTAVTKTEPEPKPEPTSTPVEQKQQPAAPKPKDEQTTRQIFPTTSADVTDFITDDDDDSDEEELYSLGSEMSMTEVDSRADDMQSPTESESRLDEVQSPTSTNEMFLMIHDGPETSMDESTVVPSTSSSTVHSAVSFSSGLKSPPSEFIPSGDPNKQNLSELVKDTQRLIQQMKDEISIDDFEPSTDDEDYTDDYSDEYDDEDIEEEEDEDDGEEEEEDEDEWEDQLEEEDEFDDVISDVTEEAAVEADVQQDITSNAYSPEPEEDHREHNNTSVLSNASQSSTQSLPLSSEHLVDEEIIAQETNITLTNTFNPNEQSAAYVESENQLPEIPVEAVVSTLVTEESPVPVNDEEPTLAFVETENSLPELPVEAVLEETLEASPDTAITAASTTEVPIVNESLPISIANVLETENSLPELPAEIALVPVPQMLPLQTEIYIPELPTEVVLVSLNRTQNAVEDTGPSQSTPNANNQSPNDSSSQITSPPSSLNNVHELPSTSGSMLSSTEPKVAQHQVVELKHRTTSQSDGNKPSTSKQAAKPKPNTAKTNSNKKAVAASKIPKPKETQKDQKSKETTKPKDPTKDSKPKETTISKRKTEPKMILPTRSKSFSGPPTPIVLTSVKTITQRFNSTQQKANKPQVSKTPTTVARKPSITEAINRLTKPSTSTELPTATSSLFRARTQPRIPKKKYHETCFSDDDYETTSSEEEPEPLEIRQRKMSVPVFRAYPSVQEPEEVKTEELVDKFMKDELVNTIAEAQIAAALIGMKFQQDVSIWAAKECSDLDHAIALLKQDCELCSGTYALNEIVSMLKCTHTCCRQCAKTYFTVQITERSINDCNCPFCKIPELHNPTESNEDDNLEYFSNLDIFLKNIVEPEVHELFQRKLRDRTLLKDPNFKWCNQCSSGFFARPKQKRLICPDCGSVTCASCRKTWQKQHEGISCEKFLEWEMGNDPESNLSSVQEHLEQNGIDCPKCKFRYSLTRGGCMHFTCTQCKFEFCYGCAKPFMMGAKCTISPYCAKLGLHAHHPRNCLFYLRDKLPVQLQILLKNNAVEFEVDPIEVNDDNDDNEPCSSQKKPALCPIPIQKETPNGLVDTKCKGDVPDKHAGMCRTHYVEYLTAKVAKAHIDPLPIFDLTDCVQELRRRGIPLPERGPWDTDEIYKTMCAELIQKRIPLDIN